jgi:hypothetical protein
MTAQTWSERSVVKDVASVFDAAVPSCRLRSMDGFFRTIDLDGLVIDYVVDEGQPMTWEQPYIAPRVIFKRIESPKKRGVDILWLFSEDDLRAFSNDILCGEEDCDG